MLLFSNESNKAFYSWIDNLKIRNKPGLKENVIGFLKEGEQVYFLNKKSAFKDKISLRGFFLNEPWLKIKTKKGKIGWVFGGGIVKAIRNSYNEFIPKPISVGENYGDIYIFGYSKKGHIAYLYDRQETVDCARIGSFMIFDLKANKIVYDFDGCWGFFSETPVTVNGKEFFFDSDSEIVNDFARNTFSIEWIADPKLIKFKNKLRQYKIIPNRNIKINTFPLKALGKGWNIVVEDIDVNKKNYFKQNIYLKSGKIKKKIFTCKNNFTNIFSNRIINKVNPAFAYLKNPFRPTYTVLLRVHKYLDYIYPISFNLSK